MTDIKKGNGETPHIKTIAQLSNIHYIYQERPNIEKAHKKADRKLSRLGYELDKSNTNKDIMTVKKNNNIHINYSGTDINNPRDILSDAALSVGTQKLNPQFNERRRKTRDIMKQYGDDKQYSLSGHSLGASILMNTLTESKSIRDRVDKAYTFNAGYTPLFHNSIKVEKPVKKQLDKIVEHHRVKGDIVSAHMNKEIAYGELTEYKADKGASLMDKHKLDNFYED